MTRLAIARKLHAFLTINRIPSNKRTAKQKAQHANLDKELGEALDTIFHSVNLKPEPAEAEAEAEGDDGE